MRPPGAGTSEAFAPFARVRVLPSGGDWPQLKAVATEIGKVLAGRESARRHAESQNRQESLSSHMLE